MKETLVWQLLIFILGAFLILTLREYLQDRIKVDAETERAKCIAEMKRTFPDDPNPYGPCTDIKTYKLKVDYQK